MNVKYALIGLFILSLAIRLYPPATNDFPVNFDSIYHARIGQEVASTGWVPAWDYAAGGRPHLYPPLYHLVLGYSSVLTGIPVISLIDGILPLVSALLVFPVFWAIRKFRGEQTALLGAVFTALNPIATAQSFDSPQLFGLLLFPLIAYCVLRYKHVMPGVLIGVCILFNYVISATIIAALLVFAALKWRRGGKIAHLACAGKATAIGLAVASPWLLYALTRAGSCFDPSTAVSSITGEGANELLIMAPVVAVFGFWALYSLGRGKRANDGYLLLWKTALAMGTIGFLASLALPQLHPYDQLLLFSFSLIFILPEFNIREEVKLAFCGILLVACVLVVTPVKPALSEDDLACVQWVKTNVHDAGVLANPEVSGAINLLTAGRTGIRTEFDLFLECIPDSARWGEMYATLKTHDSAEAHALLEAYGVGYVVVGARDAWNYGFDTSKFDSPGFEKAYSSGASRVYKVVAVS